MVAVAPPRTFKELCEKANEGDAQSQKKLADGYIHRVNENGFRNSENNFPNRTQEWETARDWYQKAAAQNYGPAQYQLGLLSYHGKGTPQDFKRAFFWFEKLAEEGDSKAQWMVGNCYYFGRGVKQDFAKAALWYGNADELADARANLGIMYERGEGVPQDFVKAAACYQPAEWRHPHPRYPFMSVGAYYNLRRLCDAGRGIERNEMEKIEKSNPILAGAVDELMRSFDPGEGHAINLPESSLGLYRLGLSHEHGFGVIRDALSTFYCLSQVAEQGFIPAQLRLGHCYVVILAPDGLCDYAASVGWYRKAADLGDPRAQYMMHHAYSSGRGVPYDRMEGIRWLEKAALQGHAPSQYHLALGYRGWRKDPVQAMYWLRQAADQGNADAQFCLANDLEDGLGGAGDREALGWYEKAVSNGHRLSQRNVDRLKKALQNSS